MSTESFDVGRLRRGPSGLDPGLGVGARRAGLPDPSATAFRGLQNTGCPLPGSTDARSS